MFCNGEVWLSFAKALFRNARGSSGKVGSGDVTCRILAQWHGVVRFCTARAEYCHIMQRHGAA